MKRVISDAQTVARAMISVVSFSGSRRFGFTPGGDFSDGVVSGFADMVAGCAQVST